MVASNGLKKPNTLHTTDENHKPSGTLHHHQIRDGVMKLKVTIFN